MATLYFINVRAVVLSRLDNIETLQNAFLVSQFVRNVVVKLGKKGILYVTEKDASLYPAGIVNKVTSVTGAGDR